VTGLLPTAAALAFLAATGPAVAAPEVGPVVASAQVLEPAPAKRSVPTIGPAPVPERDGVVRSVPTVGPLPVAGSVRSGEPAPAAERAAAEPPPVRAAPSREPASRPCPPRGAVIAVDTGAHDLWLCNDGTAEARFTIALGRGGLDKRRQGDERTPLGTYAVGEPRPSAQWGTFIPIRYPTPEQAARGYSGNAIGIHGPPRGLKYRFIGLDWTAGCVATGTDAEVEAIAEWVRERRPIVVIRKPAARREPLARGP
jgi:hypothetical protein